MAKIIFHGKDSLLAPNFDSSSFDNNNHARNQLISNNINFDLKHYSRFDVLVRVIRSDRNTYVEDPEDSKNYEEQKLRFVLRDKGKDIENLMEENGGAEEARVKLKSMNVGPEAVNFGLEAVKGCYNLSWDFHDDDDNAVENISHGKKDLKIESDGKGVTSDSKTDGGDKPTKVDHERNVALNLVLLQLPPADAATTKPAGGDSNAPEQDAPAPSTIIRLRTWPDGLHQPQCSKSLEHEETLAETFKYTHTLKANKERFADERSAANYEEYTQRLEAATQQPQLSSGADEASSETLVVDSNRIWRETASKPTRIATSGWGHSSLVASAPLHWWLLLRLPLPPALLILRKLST
ncbi:hypothetical protein Ahy_B01g052888 [Arachis hypogaea]|uniref:Uncharacterized protein n=1 Tax=Arachis hypogaea TaxID=3818 RepID=A0A445AQK7_ARAHY|nr:hypothetical protein Ahy_B01g052888 [Arachis hypogaea]